MTHSPHPVRVKLIQTWPRLRTLTFSISLRPLKVGKRLFHLRVAVFTLTRCPNFFWLFLPKVPWRREEPAVTLSLPPSLPAVSRTLVSPSVTFFSRLYLLHVEPHVQYLKVKFCSFGSRYAGTGWQLEKKRKDGFGPGRRALVSNQSRLNLYTKDGGEKVWRSLFSLVLSVFKWRGRLIGEARCCSQWSKFFKWKN